MTIEEKTSHYKQLVVERKKYSFDDAEIVNPSELNISNDEHLNAWAYLHGDLNAEILLIGQDFGDCKYYEDFDGKDDPQNPTNLNLAKLFKQLGIDIFDDKIPAEKSGLYFTNAVLGAKKGESDVKGAKKSGMAKPVKRKWYKETANKFIKPLIDIIEPKKIIAMGAIAFDVAKLIYGLDEKKFKDAVDKSPIVLPDNKKLFVVYHCSSLGMANRKFELQMADWERIQANR